MEINKLLEDEKLIENDIDIFKPISGKKKERISKIIAQAKKNRSISLRLSNFDLEKLKEKANTEGIPYQTLINSILHKYITNQLFEKDQVIKSFSIIAKS
ncbi:MAG: CopG family antitoxin [Candidatus Neomarinimicrobiota bacterium]|jgi:predicted DNA binding CopG/RHH family protein